MHPVDGGRGKSRFEVCVDDALALGDETAFAPRPVTVSAAVEAVYELTDG